MSRTPSPGWNITWPIGPAMKDYLLYFRPTVPPCEPAPLCPICNTASGGSPPSVKNNAEKLHTKNVPTKLSKRNDSGNGAGDRGTQNNVQQSKVKTGNTKTTKTAPQAIGAATSLSSSAAKETSWGTPSTLSRNPDKRRPRREAASKATKAMSSALSFSSISEGDRWWQRFLCQAARKTISGMTTINR